jgi:hypothetical protein
VEELVRWIEFGSVSPNPEVDAKTEANFERSSSWGSPSARLEAAEATLDLVLKRPDVYTTLQPIIDRMLVDPHPAVRMNTALRLVRIWDLDRQGFWTRATRLIANEQNRAVLDAFIVNTLSALVWHGAARQVADLVLPLLDRLPADDPRNGSIRQHLVQMTVQFWLRFDLPEAVARVDAWVAAAVDNAEEISQAIQWLRNEYAAGLRGEDDTDPADHRMRATGLIAAAVKQAGEALSTYGDCRDLTETQTARARSAMRIIDAACMQLYFSSGAFVNSNDQDARPPMTIAGTRVFLADMAPTLRTIGEHGGARTVYYLIQLLEHLIEADPAGVFDPIALAVQKGGRDGGYQFETLAADLMVRLIGRYLADHKEVFEEPQRRHALVETLETFVAAGWPSMRRLLYRLPELL